jgi:hypothetical protein
MLGTQKNSLVVLYSDRFKVRFERGKYLPKRRKRVTLYHWKNVTFRFKSVGQNCKLCTM